MQKREEIELPRRFKYMEKLYDIVYKHQEDLGLTRYEYRGVDKFFINYKDEYIQMKNFNTAIKDDEIRCEKWRKHYSFLCSEIARMAASSLGVTRGTYGTLCNNIANLLSRLFPPEEEWGDEDNASYYLKENPNLIKCDMTKEQAADLLLSDAYIYGIFIEEEIIYIGKTTRPIQERIREHIGNAKYRKEEDTQSGLYELLKDKDFYFKILFEGHNVITNLGLEKIEKLLINIIQPPGNAEGTYMNYHFTKDFGFFHREYDYAEIANRILNFESMAMQAFKKMSQEISIVRQRIGEDIGKNE